MFSPCHLHKPTCPKCRGPLYRREERKALPGRDGQKNRVSYSCACGWNGTPESLRMTNARRRLRRIEDTTEEEWMASMAWMVSQSSDLELMERFADRMEGLL